MVPDRLAVAQRHRPASPHHLARRLKDMRDSPEEDAAHCSRKPLLAFRVAPWGSAEQFGEGWTVGENLDEQARKSAAPAQGLRGNCGSDQEPELRECTEPRSLSRLPQSPHLTFCAFWSLILSTLCRFLFVVHPRRLTLHAAIQTSFKPG